MKVMCRSKRESFKKRENGRLEQTRAMSDKSKVASGFNNHEVITYRSAVLYLYFLESEQFQHSELFRF